ncbi:hypothetical protein PRIEUP_LOCUS164 [Pristimantis euphronides]
MGSNNLLALRAELGEQTKEIQKLQNEVEKATQNTMNQLSISYREQCYKPSTTNNHNASRESGTSRSPRGSQSFLSSMPLQALLLQHSTCTGQRGHPEEISLPTHCSLMQNTLAGTSRPADIESDKTNPKDHSWFGDSQRRREQINHFQNLHHPPARPLVNGIHLKIQELLRERAEETDMRPKSAISQEEGNKVRMRELESTNVVQEEMLKQAEAYTKLLKDKLQRQDQSLQDIQKAILLHKEQSNKKLEGNLDLSNLGIIVVQTLQELIDEVSYLKGIIQPAEDQLNFLKGELKDKEACLKERQERHDNLVNENEQQRAMLNAEVDAVRRHAHSTRTQLQCSLDQNVEHIADLESKVDQLQSELHDRRKAYKDKVEEIRKQLLSVNDALEELQNEHAQCKQEHDGQLLQLHDALETCEQQLRVEKEHSKQLQDQEMVNCLTKENLRSEVIERNIELERLQTVMKILKEESQKTSEKQLRTIQEKAASLNCMSSQLESMKGALQKTSDELATKGQRLDHAEKNVIETRNLLAEKDKSLQSVVDELKKLRLYAESKRREVRHLRADNEIITEMQKDAETLKLLLLEKDNMIVTLRAQTEAMSQMIAQQNHKVDALEADKSQLLNEAAAKKSELQDLTIRAEQKEKRILELEELCTGLELEKSKLDHSNAKKSMAAKKLKKEREDIMAELRKTQRDLAYLSEDYETLKREYEHQRGDRHNTTAILRTRLKDAMAELQHRKNTLTTVEDGGGHAVKIATRMQQKITAKREQIDTLQSSLHFLEEALSIATKDKHILKMERRKLKQECVREASERHKLSATVELLKTENDTLKETVRRTEAALGKTLLQLSESQVVIQLLEQDTMRLRLQHTLNVQELRGPVHDSPGRSPPLRTAVSLLHAAENPQKKKQMHFRDDISLSEDNVVKPLDSIHLPDSPWPFNAEAAWKLRKNTNCTSDQVSKESITLPIADLEDKASTLSVIDTVEPCHTSSLKKHIHEQEFTPRSPVHCLLTTPATENDLCGKFYSPNNDHELVVGELVSGFVSDTYQTLQQRLECLQIVANDLHMKNKELSSIIGTEGKRMSL